MHFSSVGAIHRDGSRGAVKGANHNMMIKPSRSRCRPSANTAIPKMHHAESEAGRENAQDSNRSGATRRGSKKAKVVVMPQRRLLRFSGVSLMKGGGSPTGKRSNPPNPNAIVVRSAPTPTSAEVGREKQDLQAATAKARHQKISKQFLRLRHAVRESERSPPAVDPKRPRFWRCLSGPPALRSKN